MGRRGDLGSLPAVMPERHRGMLGRGGPSPRTSGCPAVTSEFRRPGRQLGRGATQPDGPRVSLFIRAAAAGDFKRCGAPGGYSATTAWTSFSRGATSRANSLMPRTDSSCVMKPDRPIIAR